VTLVLQPGLLEAYDLGATIYARSGRPEDAERQKQFSIQLRGSKK
jgi:hypothetical protein